jgi:AcrR family transcriptional regulator
MTDAPSGSAMYRKPEKVEAIIRAASRAVARKGYAQVSLRDVAEGAGVPKSLLHYYFKDKNQLMEALLRYLNRRYIKIIDRVASLPLGTGEKLERGFEEFQKFAAREPKWMLMILDLLVQAVHRPESKKEAYSLYEELNKIIVGVLQKEKDAGGARGEIDEAVMSSLIVATLIGLGVLFILDKKATDFSLAYSYFQQMLEEFLGLRRES